MDASAESSAPIASPDRGCAACTRPDYNETIRACPQLYQSSFALWQRMLCLDLNMTDDRPTTSQAESIRNGQRTASDCGSSSRPRTYSAFKRAKERIEKTEITPYRYSALEDPRSFRLLKISKSLQDRKQPICELVHACLDDPPPYMTMSYVWGTSGPRHRLQLRTGQYLPITENLHVALPYIVKHCSDDFLWCDQVCINQQDLDERAAQVAMMGQIYSGATAVLVWLGHEISEKGKLRELLHLSGVEPQDYTWRERFESDDSVKSHIWQSAFVKSGVTCSNDMSFAQIEELRKDPRARQEAEKILRGFAGVAFSVFNSAWVSMASDEFLRARLNHASSLESGSFKKRFCQRKCS